MVMKPEPIFRAVESLLEAPDLPAVDVPVILLSPQGRHLTYQVARELARHPRLIMICGRYEGVDERVRQHLATDEISIGDFVLSGGEIAAMAVVEATVRLIPGVLGDPGAVFEDSHSEGIAPNTRTIRGRPSFAGALCRLCSNRAITPKSCAGAEQQALARTLARRPDLLEPSYAYSGG